MVCKKCRKQKHKKCLNLELGMGPRGTWCDCAHQRGLVNTTLIELEKLNASKPEAEAANGEESDVSSDTSSVTTIPG